MKLKHSAHTDVGRVREVNQDAFGMKDLTNSALFVVADGMGGYQAGEIASRTAVDTILETFEPEEGANISQELKHSFDQANQAVVAVSNGRTMGTTGVALVLYKNLAFLANVGDSRAYRVRHGELHQITLDHSLVEEQVRAGLLSKEQARISTIKNIITRAIGHQSDFQVDVFCEPVEVGDLFLLCSDGLHGYVEDEVILETVKTPPLETVTKRLIDLANEAGGPDNITAIVVRVDGLDDIPADDPLLATLLTQSRQVAAAPGPTGTEPLPLIHDDPPMQAAQAAPTAPLEAAESPPAEKGLSLWGLLGAVVVLLAIAGVLWWFDLPPVNLLFEDRTPTAVISTPTLISVPTTTLDPELTTSPVLSPTTPLSPTVPLTDTTPTP